VFDIRANHDTGVSRYGLSLLEAAAPYAVNAGWRLIAIAWPWQESQALRAVDQLGVPVLLHGLDILVCASREEGFGLAVLEATATGVPVVATRCGGPEDVIEHGATGLLVPAEDPVALAGAVEQLLAAGLLRCMPMIGDAVALAGAVEQLLASPQLATRMTARAKARYREEFTGDHGAARFTGAIRALASGKPPQAP
jgi:glycosyltransferase involved in cell wall biosynthesis